MYKWLSVLFFPCATRMIFICSIFPLPKIRPDTGYSTIAARRDRAPSGRDVRSYPPAEAAVAMPQSLLREAVPRRLYLLRTIRDDRHRAPGGHPRPDSVLLYRPSAMLLPPVSAPLGG